MRKSRFALTGFGFKQGVPTDATGNIGCKRGSNYCRLQTKRTPLIPTAIQRRIRQAQYSSLPTRLSNYDNYEPVAGAAGISAPEDEGGSLGVASGVGVAAVPVSAGVLMGTGMGAVLGTTGAEVSG